VSSSDIQLFLCSSKKLLRRPPFHPYLKPQEETQSMDTDHIGMQDFDGYSEDEQDEGQCPGCAGEDCEDCRGANRSLLAVSLWVKWVMELLLTSNMHRIRYSGVTCLPLSLAGLEKGASWILTMAYKQGLTNQIDPSTMNVRHPRQFLQTNSEKDEMAIQITRMGVHSFPGLL
jgi:hypothetical protein